MQLFLKILSGMANNVDPALIAPEEQSEQGLHCLYLQCCQKPWKIYVTDRSWP